MKKLLLKTLIPPFVKKCEIFEKPLKVIEIGRFGIEDFENGFGKEITSNGPILDS